MKNQIRQVLLAEDNLYEYSNFLQALHRVPGSIEIIRVDDGYSLLNMLETAIKPDCIFLDINMKYKNGLLTLREIKESGNLQQVPIVILSQSDYPINIELAFSLGATYFIKKPGDPQKLATTLECIFSCPYLSSGTQPPKDRFYIC